MMSLNNLTPSPPLMRDKQGQNWPARKIKHACSSRTLSKRLLPGKSSMSGRSLMLIAVLCLLFSSCATQISGKKVGRMIERSAILRDHFTGFALFDVQSNRMVFEKNSALHFIPASNTKLFTFYTCLNVLGDSIPGIRYVTRNDSLIFWGTGDPSLLHTYLKSDRIFNFFKTSNKKLFYSPDNYSGDVFGRGWPLDNYNDYYQAEITDLPLEDNVAVVRRRADGSLSISPRIFQSSLRKDGSFRPETFTVKRQVEDNVFIYPAGEIPDGFKQEIPWKTSPALTASLLQDTLKRSVGLVHLRMPKAASTLYSIPADSVYKRMLQVSDNFLAEQLLLVCSSKLYGALSTDSVINYSASRYLSDLPDPIQWVDGSGLSRHNLFTPRSIVKLLVKIKQKVGDEEKLHDFLPAGGMSGTLRLAYKTDEGKPFVWAKTGSLSNNHNQSGYLITRKGRHLVFSFMNNNYVRPTSEVRSEMVRIMTDIHNQF